MRLQCAFAVIGIAGFGLAACHSSTGPGHPPLFSMTGTWSATDSLHHTMILHLTQRSSDHSVYGSGTVGGIDVQVHGENGSCDAIPPHICPDYEPKVNLYLTD